MIVAEHSYSGRAFHYQVDCGGIEGHDSPQAFIVSVPVDGPDDAQRLAWFRRSYVILDEERKEPAYLLLDESNLVACTNVRASGDSQKVLALKALAFAE